MAAPFLSTKITENSTSLYRIQYELTEEYQAVLNHNEVTLAPSIFETDILNSWNKFVLDTRQKRWTHNWPVTPKCDLDLEFRAMCASLQDDKYSFLHNTDFCL